MSAYAFKIKLAWISHIMSNKVGQHESSPKVKPYCLDHPLVVGCSVQCPKLCVGGVRSCVGIYSRHLLVCSVRTELRLCCITYCMGGMAHSEGGGVTMVALSATIHLYVQYGWLEALGQTLHYAHQGWWQHWLLEGYWLFLPPVESWLLHSGLMANGDTGKEDIAVHHGAVKAAVHIGLSAVEECCGGLNRWFVDMPY